MLDYDYLVRPVKLVPRTLDAMPTIEDNGDNVRFPAEAGNLLHAGPGVRRASRVS